MGGWIQGKIEEVAKQLAGQNPEVEEEKAKAAFEKAWEATYELADMLGDSKKITLLARPENLQEGAIRLIAKKETLYGEGKDAEEEGVLETALRTFGGMKQIMKTVEELSELQKELCKYYSSEEDRNHIAEEIADVRIMLEQMELLFSCEAQVQTAMERKLDRLAERLGL